MATHRVRSIANPIISCFYYHELMLADVECKRTCDLFSVFALDCSKTLSHFKQISNVYLSHFKFQKYTLVQQQKIELRNLCIDA